MYVQSTVRRSTRQPIHRELTSPVCLFADEVRQRRAFVRMSTLPLDLPPRPRKNLRMQLLDAPLDPSCSTFVVRAQMHFSLPSFGPSTMSYNYREGVLSRWAGRTSFSTKCAKLPSNSIVDDANCHSVVRSLSRLPLF